MKKIIVLILASSAFLTAQEIILDVDKTIPIYETKTVKVQECSKDNSANAVGTVAGATAGGLIGNQFGGGKGKTIATIGGAAAGAVVGNVAQGSMKTESCKEVTKEGEKTLVGYKNIAVYKGTEYSKVTAEPQAKIRVDVK